MIKFRKYELCGGETMHGSVLNWQIHIFFMAKDEFGNYLTYCSTALY